MSTANKVKTRVKSFKKQFTKVFTNIIHIKEQFTQGFIIKDQIIHGLIHKVPN